MKRDITILIIVIYLLGTGVLSSQPQVNWVKSHPAYVTLNDLVRLQVYSQNSDNAAGITIRLYSSSQERVWEQQGSIDIRKGYNNYDQIDIYNEMQFFRDQKFSERYNKLNSLPPGNYTVCIEIELVNGLTSECFSFIVNPQSPPRLVYPFNKSEVYEPYPVFSWLPPVPVVDLETRYTIRIFRIHEGQTQYLATGSNPPHYFKENINRMDLPYPGYGEPLKQGQKFAWQISAFDKDGFYLGSSEVWEFNVAEEREEPDRPDIHVPYVGLKESPDGGFYMAPGVIRFRFDGRYDDDKLQFEIRDGQGKDFTPPYIFLTEHHGDNRYELDLLGTGIFEEDKLYTLIVRDRKGAEYFLRFKYTTK